ncbi:hypothetical protein ACQ4WP_26960 [Janthinobacterium sp. GB4P2]|uniref:hypothetical protein n=1 Tax=Janthinobacterium sp. GB4P2 TaxID=3424189 RepID=UPI003F24D6BE
MHANDYDDFAQLLDDAYDLIGVGANKAISGGAKSMFFAAMAPYSLATVRAALGAHCVDKVRGRFTPKPADIIEQIEASALNDGRPGAEEAWAIALTSRDESDTVVWTAECAEAFALAGPILALGDEVGARMAFKEAYIRIVAQARAERRPATWSASMGWDQAKRAAVLGRAATAGLLPAPMVQALLPAPVEVAPADDKARAQLTEIKRMLAASAGRKEQARLDAHQQQVLADEQWKRDTSDRVRRYMGG